ncbi:UDP-N-acetylmuramoylalanyl-D-glutamyl-2, 6-diaminopimelate--D-alanyl-D-alanine ligase [Staphylococcus microti]|uniref:UDP-N-acetylmuramoyl-tripeptide--D-alanyl-D-alanine ligase n=1 Tax=Staphylococcus microti TaxID=569857 RepID=A0A0D6XS11_9STAP|nr:UDP-N-acetylmuramoyl-tripeptide--D-alanyl-D-alanine ligase [Staphylococcus microti]KIX91377.1 UDP-N-acetylmuramoylalanyl-D-glutamyl-2, 6-diaminopimelate--D-alanyl-D-alanine ligase [Staphylococcus microti]PNZ75964.1 UDP-N-acetylmuramoyl-tripeptide--D-alanyl-D-alanine ligase [Staphylococcus microti]SUM58024.1 UDP-N-acetylmuramoyl-tripeptide--D-alanyl-D-alanine ligase [Staphylococcus microti]
MINISLRQLAQWITCEIDDRYLDVMIQGVTIDSRHIEAGQLFIPFNGERVDGHRFSAQALQDGAAATFFDKHSEVTAPSEGPVIYVEDTLQALQQLAAAYLREVDPTVIAVTGSNGKTTTKDMLENVLSANYKVQKTQGNYNNEIGMPLTILALSSDTQVSILEMGMSGFGEIELLSDIARPDFAIITNIGESHMQDLGSRAGIAQAKFEIISGLKTNGRLFYDGDEPLLAELVEGVASLDATAIGTAETNAIQCEVTAHDASGITFILNGKETYQLPVLGAHNMKNAAYAIAVAKALGVDDKTIRQQLQQLELTGMRMQRFTAQNGAVVINDAYNASPTSMKAAIDTLTQMAGRKILVFGDVLELGPQSTTLHAEVGRYLADKAIDVLFTYGEASEALNKAGAPYVRQAKHFDSKDQLIETLSAMLESEDVVLVKGSRGMKLEEVVEALITV